MLLNIIHLSDLHLRADDAAFAHSWGTAVAAAAAPGVPNVALHLVIVSGDIANTGTAAEFQTARCFLEKVRAELRQRSAAEVAIATVPGNHDCSLKVGDVALRRALVAGALDSFSGPDPDPAILRELLAAQQAYWDFDGTVSAIPARGDSERICRFGLVPNLERPVQLNLYNSALLSQRDEKQGGIQLPIDLAEATIQPPQAGGVSIAVLHHSQWWFESNNWVALRRHLARTATVLLTGHQHAPYASEVETLGGGRLVYGEAGELHGAGSRLPGVFETYVVDLAEATYYRRVLRWSSDQFTAEEGEPRKLPAPAPGASDLKFTDEFALQLGDIGTGYTHPRVAAPRLPSLFTWPPLSAYSFGSPGSARYVAGARAMDYVLGCKKLLLHGPALVGRSALGKMLTQFLRERQEVPLLLNGRTITSKRSSFPGRALFREHVAAQYGTSSRDAYFQLPAEARALIVDDWQDAYLNDEGRKKFLTEAAELYGRIILLTDSVVPLLGAESESGLPEVLADFECGFIREFNSRARLDMIEKWLLLGRESSIAKGDLVAEVDKAEKYVNGAIGKNRLPSLPFVVLATLQQFDSPERSNPESGSFGYLYEVLVTSALSRSESRRPQLERKYQFLTMLGEHMHRKGLKRVDGPEFRDLLERYKRDYAVAVDPAAMISDLCGARVLAEREGEYFFNYDHFYFYFVARYFKGALLNDPAVRDRLYEMCDNLSDTTNAEIVMFTIYLTHDASLIDRLVKNANATLSGVVPAELESDVGWLNSVPARFPPSVISDCQEDVLENRRASRDSSDKFERDNAYVPAGPPSQVRLALRQVELLGQVMRNFPGSLNAGQKDALIRSAVGLTLRALAEVFNGLSGLELSLREARAGDAEILEVAQKLIRFLARICTQGCVRHLSTSIGVAESEPAYNRALEAVGETSAIEIVSTTIRMDHFGGFPESRVTALAESLKQNPFAFAVLGDIVASHLAVFDAPQAVRAKMAKLFNRRRSPHELAASPQSRF